MMDRKQVKALFDGLSPGAREAFNGGNIYRMGPHAPELIAAGLIYPETVHGYTELGKSVSDPDARASVGELAEAINEYCDWDLIAWADADSLAAYRVDAGAVATLIATHTAAVRAANAALVSAIRALPEVE